MKYVTYAAVGFFAVIAACSASGVPVDESKPEPAPSEEERDGGMPIVDASAADRDAPDIDLDAERPLACGDAGFCETKLPRSDLGLPLSLRSVWMVASNDVWSVTLEGMILHYDGASWTTAYKANHELYAVWATPTSVWAGGEAGLLLRRNAAGEWSRVDAPHASPIRAIYGTDDDDVWFTSDDRSVEHFDGTALKRHPIDVPGLKITTVFGRPGFGTYAAGYVPGPPLTAGRIQDQPYAFELSTTNISVFNASLTTKRAFLPMAGAVTASSDPDRRVYLVGYDFDPSFQSNTRYMTKYCLFGASNSVSVRNLSNFVTDDQRAKERRAPVLVYHDDDIRLVWSHTMLGTWNGSGISNLGMGNDFPFWGIFGAHNNATDVWVVGNGFALKGATP